MAMVNVKERELTMVREKFTQACRKMIQNTDDAGITSDQNKSLYSEVAAWALYERRIRDTKEWPYNAGIIRQLIISIMTSGIIYGIKLFWGSFSG